ncbi:Subtilisin Carlsberg [Colletotrichum tanaceti]|uniref:Subtilisin Carlsberg n=1 Tax=Colletotrichum tanaceti TaxID=1306861 RepID=A0A4U6XS11_9PEZI|nr:Subtilisin Carlsberg [Colletotrichum tanaceti]
MCQGRADCVTTSCTEYDGSNEKNPDGDPLDSLGHGTQHSTLAGEASTAQLAYIPPVNRALWNITSLPIIPLAFDTGDPAELRKRAARSRTRRQTSRTSSCSSGEGTCTPYVKQAKRGKSSAPATFSSTTTTPVRFELVANSAHTSQMALIDAKAGAAIIETVKAGGGVTADFSAPTDGNWAVGFFDAAGGVSSQYTSRGGTYELEIKPDIAAPGANIYSTYLDGTYKVLSGTSMATPYVAGVAALYISKHEGRSVHGKDFATQLSGRIVSSGESLPWQLFEPQGLPTDFEYLAPVTQVGNGILNASKLLGHKTSLSFEKFALNDTGSFSRYHTVEVTNNGDSPVTYNFTLEPASGLFAQGRISGLLADILDAKPFSLVPTVTFPSGVFRVNPGESKELEAQCNFMFPETIDEAKLPVYSGRIVIKGSNGETVAVPYMGAAFNLKTQMRGAMFPPTYPVQRSGPGSQDIDAYHTYAFNTSRAAQDFPKVNAKFKWGTKELRWDIFDRHYKESDWAYPPVVGENGYVGAATYSTYASGSVTFDPATMDREKVLPFPLRGIERTTTWSESADRFWWLGKLANGSYIAPGNYT